MDLPVVDNEFLSLFLPDTSEFTSEEILEEFKIYIFRIMNLSLDSLIQEQINNDYENNLLRKEFKSFFAQRISLVLEINKLYCDISKRVDTIKFNLEKIKENIDHSTLTVNSVKTNEKISAIAEKIREQKNIINKHQALLEILSIPCYMIDCFKNNTLDLYLDYLSYIKSIPMSDLISFVLLQVDTVNDAVLKIIKKKLEQGNIADRIQWKYYFIILNMEVDSIFKEYEPKDVYISLSVAIYSVKSYQGLNLLEYISKVNTVIKEFVNLSDLANKEEIYNKTILHILEQYAYPKVKSLCRDKSFQEQHKTIRDFLDSIQMDYIPILDYLKELSFNHLDLLIQASNNRLTNFLTMCKDLRKLLAIDHTQDKIKYDVLIVLYNNLVEIFNALSDIQIKKITDKHLIIEKTTSHVRSILDIIQNFLEDNMYTLKVDCQKEEFILFRTQLFEEVLTNFMQNVFLQLDLEKMWELKALGSLLRLYENYLITE